MRYLQLTVLASLLCSATLAVDCSNFQNEMLCANGQVTTNPSDWADRSFQAPLPNDPYYKESYQSLGRVACYPEIQYTADRKGATVTVVCRKHSSIQQINYALGSSDYKTDNKIQLTSSWDKPLTMKVQALDHFGKVWEQDLDPINFVWQANTVNQGPQYNNGQKGGIVELFGWPYKDIMEECPSLGKMGWMGVKVFPPSEHVMTDEWPQNGELNPWWFLYQPVSYKLTSRHGTRAELREMIQKCRESGVRVYADAVVNHMSGGGNDVWPEHRNGGGSWCSTWGPKDSSAGSPYFTHDWMYQNSNNTKLRPGLEYPSVPYNPTDFHCERSLNSWTDPFQLNNGWLVGLADLDTESDYVRNRIAQYMVDLLSIGFSGFRVDAAKHIYPKSLAAIFKKFKDYMGGGELPDDFITYLEVIIGGEKDLLMCSNNDYCFGGNFANFMKDAGLSDGDIAKIKIWESDYPKEFPICGYWPIPSERYAVENDCHDDQNPGSSSRDMGDKGSVLVIQKDVPKHRGFEVQLFQRTDANWQIKLVLSSYSFMDNGAMGYPDGYSDCKRCKGEHCGDCHKSMPYSKAHDDNVCGYTCSVNGQWKEGVYTRVHRDYDIIQAMRDWQGLPKVTDPTQLGLPSHCRSAMEAEKEQFLTQ